MPIPRVPPETTATLPVRSNRSTSPSEPLVSFGGIVGLAGPSRGSSAPDAGGTTEPALPAGSVPVPALVQGEAAGHPGAVGGPGHHVRGPRHDLLVASGAAVRLGRRRAGHPADDPVAVRPRLDALGPGHGVRRAGAVAADPARAHACPA